MKNLVRIMSIALSFIIILLVLSSFITGFDVKAEEKNVLEVSQTGNHDYTIIQEAINSAEEGYTVYVYKGTYYENLVIDKKINLVGEDKENTIIDGKEKSDVIRILSDSVNITGFTIQNAGFYLYNDGIDIDSCNNKIANNIIKRCRCGIALELWANNCEIFQNNIEENSFGVMIYSIKSNNNIIYENNFIRNYHNGYDDSKGRWSHNSRGNYWDDYNGTDNDGDGIGDTPYNINGGTTQDKYPLVEPVETPGFELILILGAITIFTILKKKKKDYL